MMNGQCLYLVHLHYIYVVNEIVIAVILLCESLVMSAVCSSSFTLQLGEHTWRQCTCITPTCLMRINRCSAVCWL